MNKFENDMDDLLIRYLAREATDLERAEVSLWLQQNPANRVHFEQLQKIWDGSGELAPQVSANTDEAWTRFQHRVQPSLRLVRGRRNRAWMKIAASIILVLTAAFVGYEFLFKAPAPPQMMALTTRDMVEADTLPDGSVATLNKHSSIQYPRKFSGKTRPIHLEGEAFFRVAPDKKKPFIINVNDVEVKVLGTSFNVKSFRGSTEIIVETGLVEVISEGKALQLGAGERTLIRKDSAVGKTVSRDKLYNYYVSRTFICDNTPLWKLVDKLNEAYDVHIVIGSARSRKLPLNVTFSEESLETILEIIAQTLSVRISREDNQILIH